DESDDEDVEIFGIQQPSNHNALSINETAEISVEQLRNNIKEIIYEQLEDLDEQSFHQNKTSSNELIKTYNDEDLNSYNHSTKSQMMIDEPQLRKEEHKYQEQSKKVKNGSKQRITLYHAPLPRITDIDNVSETSPLSQPFANENTILPFYIICREEELCEATQNVIQQQTPITDDDEKEIGNKRKIRKGIFRERSKKKLEESIKSFVYDQIFGKKGTCKYGNEYSILDEDDYEQKDNNESDILSWCFQVSDNINLISALTEEEEHRVTHEVWKMPNFESEVFSEVKESVINELQQLTPIKANSAEIAFQARTRTEGKHIEGKRIEGTGAMPLNLSRDVLSFANNVSGQHIEDLRKQIFLSKSQLFKNEDVSWCLNPFGIQDRKSSRKGKEVKCNDESDNYEYKMEKQGSSLNKKEVVPLEEEEEDYQEDCYDFELIDRDMNQMKMEEKKKKMIMIRCFFEGDEDGYEEGLRDLDYYNFGLFFGECYYYYYYEEDEQAYYEDPDEQEEAQFALKRGD
ncbi:MAG: hypothetical protein EZS28_032420, partial [Streblomastix strix]